MNLFSLKVGIVLQKRLQVLEALEVTDSADGRLNYIRRAVTRLWARRGQHKGLLGL